MDKLDTCDLPSELQQPGTHALLVAFLDLMYGRVRLVAHFRAAGYTRLTMHDSVVALHVFVFRDIGGTRQQHLIDVMASPRMSIVDSLKRLEGYKLICRDRRGVYFPCPSMGEIAHKDAADTMRLIDRLCVARLSHKDDDGPRRK